MLTYRCCPSRRFWPRLQLSPRDGVQVILLSIFNLKARNSNKAEAICVEQLLCNFVALCPRLSPAIRIYYTLLHSEKLPLGAYKAE